MHYVAFIHQDDEPGYGISFPDFPGCISAGDTMDEVLRRGAEALAFHVKGMKEHGEPIPAPRDLPTILADDILAEWRSGATFTSVPLAPES
ncbi:type II toxin-antitoxin system HicB family antitoxin [Pannonibacter phragmitetus]|uniref:type II toxin-antitoxin system HicB family antitoxin n=1 Tax=Pannonibacter phragmitetus TaxID=121719 RepID=UPI00067B791B|nr:type II toxin-antitoxin system HicB family antitoxin [Pannonibacter phragmitetus]